LAYYCLNGSIDTHELGINGNALDEIVNDMIKFTSGMDEQATTFELPLIPAPEMLLRSLSRVMSTAPTRTATSSRTPTT
jgi:hypothetical protein